MSAAAGAAPVVLGSRRAISPWVVAVAVVIPTFMEVLDTTIANVALRYIAGGLSAPFTDSEWVITSYLAANAIVLPISGWLGARLGRRNYFLLSILTFTLASVWCGVSTSLGMLIAARTLQGLAGGGLQPSSQGILLDAFPASKQGLAQTLFAVAALLAPVVGPTLGGFITDNYGWRWIFYLNLPVGLFAFFFCRAVVRDPDYLVAQRQKLRSEAKPFDTAGLSLLVGVIVCWEILLSKGQEWDWFGDPVGRVQVLAALFGVGLVGLVLWELRAPSPLLNFKALRDRNFRSACVIIACAFGLLYANTTTLPGLLQSLFGYDATTSGLVLSPAGMFAVTTLLIVGALLTRGADARYLLVAGLCTVSAGNFWMARLNLEISPWQVVWPRAVVVVGLSMMFAPINVAAFKTIPMALRGAAVGMLALLRNEGGSMGTSIAQTVHERREQFHVLRLNEKLDRFNPALVDALERGERVLGRMTGDAPMARRLALEGVRNARDREASALAYFDIFWLCGALALGLVLLVLLMKPSVITRGEHAAAE